MEGSRGGADQSLLVVVRQIMLLTFLLLAVFAACLSRHGAAVHMWLEGSWWLVGTVLAVFLAISGILNLLSSNSGGDNAFMLLVVEQVELIAYLLLALGASLGRTRHGEKYKWFRTAFWVATILLVVLWSVSSLLDIMTSERALPGTIITMSVTLVTAVLMLADLCVTYWHGTNASGVTEQDARNQAHQPFLEAHGKHSGHEGGLGEGHDQESGYASVPGGEGDHKDRPHFAAADVRRDEFPI